MARNEDFFCLRWTEPDFVQTLADGRVLPDDVVTPLRLADALESDGRRALEVLDGISDSTHPGLALEAADAEAWACLSLYFAEKLRGAVAYHQRDRKAAAHLAQAVHWWDELIRITDPIYAEMPLAQLHRKNRPFHWKRLRPHVVRDLQLAQDMPEAAPREAAPMQRPPGTTAP